MRKDVTVEERTRAIQRGVREALTEHALLGRSVCIMRNKQIVWLSPDEIFEELRRTDPDAGKHPESPRPTAQS